MAKFTIEKLMRRARERADMVHSDFVTDSELRGYLGASLTELYEILIHSGLFYFDPGTQTIAADGSETYDLPSDYYATLRVDYKRSANYYTELFEFMEQERAMFENSVGGATSGYATYYQILGTKLALLPAPAGGEYRHRYIPQPLDIGDASVSDQAEIDGVNGWEEWVIVDAARKMLSKEESSTVSVERDLERLKRRIEDAAAQRAWSSPRRVVSMRERRRNSVDWWFDAGTAD
jgi:hypothetical protein